ncbi:MAG TPA: glycosyltransferase family 39 protein [Geminicoccus sp.]|nr:glycosyltransferase family 39 protein [Geminicoccus sp.]
MATAKAESGAAERTASGQRWLAPLLVFLGALALFCINLDDGLPVHDELYHLLAARGLLATGLPSIAEGLYERGYAYTWIVAQCFRLFGDNLFVARLPAAVSMALLVAAMFWWLRAKAGDMAAWIGAALFATSPFAVGTAQFARFYGPQSLLFFLGTVAAFEALRGADGPVRRGIMGMLAAACLAMAAHLQDTTILGIAGLAAWIALALGLPRLADPDVPPGRKLLVAGGLLAAAAVALTGMWTTGMLAGLWARYRWAPLFNQGDSGQFWFYHGWLSLFYPSLWPATGLLGLLAIVARPGPGLLALVVFAVSFLLNSFAGPKSLRYLAYAFPFLFAVWGIGIAALWPGLRDGLRRIVEGLAPALGIAASWGTRLGRGLAACAIAFLLLGNPAWLRTGTLLADISVPPEDPYIRWQQAATALSPWLASAEVVVTTAELETLFHYGRYDLLLSRSRMEELGRDERREFGRDWRTGRPIVAEAATLGTLMDCTASGLVISHRHHWKVTFQADAAAKVLIEQRATPVQLPPGSQMLAWTWQQPAGWSPPTGCADTRRELHLPAH